MADQDKQKDILERVSDLPEDLRKALFARTTTDAIQEVGKKNALPLDKVGELADETGLVMLGITPPSEYIKNLTRRLGVDTEKAKAIAEEINQKIFQPVRESLKRVHGLGEQIKDQNVKTKITDQKQQIEKRLPTKEEIREPIEIKSEPLPKPPPPAPLIIEPMRSKEEALPPIFVKKIPQPTALQLGGQALPDIIPEPTKKLPPQKTHQSNDPYHEPIE